MKSTYMNYGFHLLFVMYLKRAPSDSGQSHAYRQVVNQVSYCILGLCSVLVLDASGVMSLFTGVNRYFTD